MGSGDDAAWYEPPAACYTAALVRDRQRLSSVAFDHPALRAVALLLCVTACGRLPAGPRPPTGPAELVVSTVPAVGARHTTDEYLQLVVDRVHVRRPDAGRRWWSPHRYLEDRSARTILTIGVQVNGQTVGVLPVATLEARADAVVREVKENQPLTAPLRLQQGDQVTLQASLVEATAESATRLMEVAQRLGGVAALPVSTAVPGGGAAVDLAGQFWQLARAAGRPRDLTLKREGGLDRPLWAVERIEIVPSTDRERFALERERLLDPATALLDTDPTFVVLRVERRSRLYDPELVLAAPSPMRERIAHFLEELREGTDAEKVKTCRRLRRFLRNTVGVTPADETAVVLAAMRETGYDPDRSRLHTDGCLTDDDIRVAARRGFRWGSCDASAPCRLARLLAESWFARASLVALLTAPVAVYDQVFAAGAREDIDPGELLELFRLEPGWEAPQPESADSARFLATVAREGVARPAAIRVSVVWDAQGTGPRIARIDLFAGGITTPPGRAPEPSSGTPPPGPSDAPPATPDHP